MTAPAKLRAAMFRVPLGELRVLELASGPGLYLQHFGPGSIGLDTSVEACEEARSRGLDVRNCNLDESNWSDVLEGAPPLQAVWLCDVLMHVAEPSQVLREVGARLSPGTPVLCIEWCLPGTGPLQALRTWLCRRMPGMAAILTEPTHLRSLRLDEIEALLQDAGLAIEDTWLHSFEGKPMARLLGRVAQSFWPVRTILARKT